MTDSVCTSANCISNGDYYEAAKRKCQSSGGHLPTLAELKIAKNNGKFNGGWFWASEENSSAEAYLTFMSGNTIVNNATKGYTDTYVICVSD